MNILVGFAVGYVLGAKAGREKYDELRDAWQTITGSAEFRALVAAGTTLLTRAVLEGGLDGSKGLSTFRVGNLLGDQLRQVVTAAMSLAGKNDT